MGDCVCKELWLWLPEQVVEKLGAVLYYILLKNGRRGCRHVEQLRYRTCSGVRVESPAEEASGERYC